MKKALSITPFAQAVVTASGLTVLAFDDWRVSVMWLFCMAALWAGGYGREDLTEGVDGQHERIV